MLSCSVYISVAIHEISKCFLILGLSVEGPSTDGTGELALGSGCRGQIASLGEDLLGVGVGSGFVHVATIHDLPQKSSDSGHLVNWHQVVSVKQMGDLCLNLICYISLLFSMILIVCHRIVDGIPFIFGEKIDDVHVS